MGDGGSGLRPQVQIDVDNLVLRHDFADPVEGDPRTLFALLEVVFSARVFLAAYIDDYAAIPYGKVARLEQALSKFDFGGESVG